MQMWPYIAGAVVVTVGAVLVTGRWCAALGVFKIRPERMTAQRLGLNVYSPEGITRVNTILESFLGGFNKMITSRRQTAAERYCDSLPVLYRPFAHEGLAMGYTLRHLLRYDPATFEERVVKPRPEFRYLYYVGLGFWWGMRGLSPHKVPKLAEGLDPLHGYLCFDGYGFKAAFFNYPKNEGGLKHLEALPGYAENAAFQGVGRAFYFLFMERPDLLVEHVRRLGEHACDAAAGAGLAAVFVNPDRLDVALELANKLPQGWHSHFHLGMCFGLKARSLNNLDKFEQDLSLLERPVREAVYASIRECDRVELQVRADGERDGYRRWRERVTEWMGRDIDYPLAGVVGMPAEAERQESRVPSQR